MDGTTNDFYEVPDKQGIEKQSTLDIIVSRFNTTSVVMGMFFGFGLGLLVGTIPTILEILGYIK